MRGRQTERVDIQLRESSEKGDRQRGLTYNSGRAVRRETVRRRQTERVDIQLRESSEKETDREG